ncbi:unnamed protein product [Boreogadus saida]
MGDIRLTTMSVNNTCQNGSLSPGCPPQPEGSSTGLAVGLSVFFLLLLLMAPIVFYVFYVKRYHSHSWRLDRARPGKREDPAQIERQAAAQRYSTMGRAPAGEEPSPIYENYSGQTAAGTASTGGAHTSPRELEDDLYYQCDSADDAIYGNDPNFSLAMLSEDGEDPYIIPDTL